MKTYSWSPMLGISEVESQSRVALSDIRDAILSGNQVCVIDAESGADVTQNVLLDILKSDEGADGNSEYLVRMLEGAVRLKSLSDVSYGELLISHDSESVALTDIEKNSIKAWMRCMEDYGDIWQEDFGWAYFSQEYWYLLIKTIACHWREEPLNVQAACRAMKNGSRRTRESRLNHILAENWIVKRSDQSDQRRIWVQPTEDMLELSRAHLWRSLKRLVTRGVQFGILHDKRATSVLENVNAEDNSNDKPYLLPWAEFLIAYTDHWNATFHNRFPTEEYWYLFSHTLRAHWREKPLTMRETCEQMKTGTIRTRESKIHRAIASNFIERSKRDEDMRSTVLNITPRLESRLSSHFCATLHQFGTLTDDLLQITGNALESN